MNTITSTVYRYTGSRHPFYEFANTYNLKVQQTLVRRRICVQIIRGKENNIHASRTKYRNFEEFKQNWSKVHA